MRLFFGNYVDDGSWGKFASEFFYFLFYKFDNASGSGEEGVVFAAFDVLAGMIFCAALADYNITGFSICSAEKFNTESLGL